MVSLASIKHQNTDGNIIICRRENYSFISFWSKRLKFYDRILNKKCQSESNLKLMPFFWKVLFISFLFFSFYHSLNSCDACFRKVNNKWNAIYHPKAIRFKQRQQQLEFLLFWCALTSSFLLQCRRCIGPRSVNAILFWSIYFQRQLLVFRVIWK